MEITGESITSAIALNLRSGFTSSEGEPPVIYKDQTVQDKQVPSFFIWTMDVDNTKVGRYYEQLYQMNIRYELEEGHEKPQETLRAIGMKCLDILGVIEVDNRPLNSTSINYQIVEGVLQVFANYTLKVTKPSIPQVVMGDLTIINR